MVGVAFICCKDNQLWISGRCHPSSVDKITMTSQLMILSTKSECLVEVVSVPYKSAL